MNIALMRFINRLIESSFVRNSGIYTFTSIINAGIPLLLLPILTHKLTPADYGIVAMFQLAVNVVYPFIGMNVEGSITRRYYEKDCTDFSSYIGSCLLLVLVGFVVVSGISWIWFDTLKQITQIPELWIKYIFIVAICQIITNIILAIYQVKEKPLKYGLLQILQSLLNISFTIFLVVTLNKTWDGRIEAQVISGVIFALISFILLWKTGMIGFNVTKIYFQHALKFGLPLIPHAIGSIMFTAIDRFFLTKILGLEHTGNYSVAFQLGAVFSLFTVAINNAYVPWLFKNLNTNKDKIKLKIVKFTYLYFLLLCILGILVILLFPIGIYIFVDSAFKSVNVYSTFIVFGFVFQGMYFMVTNYVIYANKTYIQAVLTIAVGLIKIPLTYFLILWLGAVGASVSFCITFFLFFIFTWIISSRVYSMPWMLNKINNY